MTTAYYPILILLAPLAAALITALPGDMIGRKAFRFAVLAKAAAFVVSLQVLIDVAAPGHRAIHVPIFSSPLSGFLSFDLYIDRLAAVMMTVISGITTLIALFSTRYMQPERGRGRYHTLLALTAFSLLCMVSSANLLMLFFFWQLLSFFLSLLSYNYQHPPTVQGSFRTYTMLRIGDVGFLAGIVLAYQVYGTLDFRQLFSRAAEVTTTFSLLPGGGLEISAATAVTLLIFIGAMSKSAQFPLHGWLPESLFAPTPVHALLHAGIINAGGFLLNRLAPLYGLSTPTLHVVFAVGLFTAFLGASMMLTQNDIKKTLGYSTIGQMGYMIMECGLGAFALAVFHLIAHGLFKGTVFLNCGNVIHDARKEPRNPPQDEVEEKMEFSYVTWITGVVTTLVLPLIILLAIHGVLDIPLLDSQGVMILLFFSWVTSSQAILALYRMRAVASWKVAATMLLTLIVIVLTYLLAVESFTHFLYPDKAEVAFYYQAAALPGWLFDLVVAATALCIIMGWTFIYAKTHGQTLRVPEFVKIWQVRFYLLFVNRLYLDDFALRASRGFMRTARRLDNSRAFQYVSGLVAIVAALPLMVQADNPSIANIGIFFALAFLLPLFPLHGIYVAALTRPKGYLPVALAILLPAAGLFGVMGLLPVIPKDILRGVGIMALFGAVFGSFKALVQTRLAHVLAYAGLALFSILWWFLAESRTVAPQAAAYAVAVILATGGLFLALHYAKSRYGDLDTANIGGLGRAMPRFAVLLSLLIMAAMGLPPFGLFSGYVEMLLHPAVTMGGELVVVLVAWFAVSWYLFRLLQRVLFGPHRTDIVYEDLRNVEVVSLLMVVLVLAAIGLTPYGFFGADMLMELKQ